MTKLVGGCRLLPLKVCGDERGSLVAIEDAGDIPFPIRRVYYIYGTSKNVGRGKHAHENLLQLAIAVSGSCVFHLDDGANRQEVELKSPAVGLLIGPMIWREMTDFTPDCVLLVLASAPYNEADYIRDYNLFVKVARS